jgi:hypothetical protein
MKFRNYCVMILGNTEDALQEIEKVSESDVNTLNAKGVFIATFTSAIEPKEMSDFFTLNKRSFFLFDLNEENSGFNITRKDIHETLFGFIDKTDLTEKSNDFFKAMNMSGATTRSYHTTQTSKTKEPKEIQISEEEIGKMSPKDKKNLLDEIIEKGVANLTEYDKKILPLLAK